MWKDLTLYRGHHTNEDLNKHILSLPPTPPADQIVDVLNELVSTHRGAFQKFLVRWKDCPILDASWITATNFHLINPSLYERYQAIHSPESSFSRAGRTSTGRAKHKSNGPDP